MKHATKHKSFAGSALWLFEDSFFAIPPASTPAGDVSLKSGTSPWHFPLANRASQPEMHNYQSLKHMGLATAWPNLGQLASP
ncbi:hypothetical protein [Schlesneria sp.]|uniref:hypothetical protein n=1 Tax=Schlesneria sp. TaxID=2762018 RepID=UPI002EF3A63F